MYASGLRVAPHQKVPIGRFGHEIIYEGISLLCFSCGRIGHWKEACPYVIKEVSVDHTPGSEPIRENAMVTKTTIPGALEVDTVKEEYGPWMLVWCRKQSYKPRTNHPSQANASPSQAFAFNAKDMGSLFYPNISVIPPSRPLRVSPKGKRKLMRLYSTNHSSPLNTHKAESSISHTPIPPPQTSSSLTKHPGPAQYN